MGVHGDEVIPTLLTGDAAVKADPGHVHWITAGNSHATDACVVQLSDAADDSNDVWELSLEAQDILGGGIHCVFDPPMRFKVGIYADLTGGTPKVTVGWT
jgi:hypothetical protein